MNKFSICELIFSMDFLSPVFGFIGTLLIFFFGLPPKVDPDGHINLILEQEDKTEKIKGKKYKQLGYIGIFLVSISFLIQLIKSIML